MVSLKCRTAVFHRNHNSLINSNQETVMSNSKNNSVNNNANNAVSTNKEIAMSKSNKVTGSTETQMIKEVGVYSRDSLEYTVRRFFREDGTIWREEFYLKGKLHRENGPAVIEYRPDESISKEEYFVEGKHPSVVAAERGIEAKKWMEVAEDINLLGLVEPEEDHDTWEDIEYIAAALAEGRHIDMDLVKELSGKVDLATLESPDKKLKAWDLLDWSAYQDAANHPVSRGKSGRFIDEEPSSTSADIPADTDMSSLADQAFFRMQAEIQYGRLGELPRNSLVEEGYLPGRIHFIDSTGVDHGLVMPDKAIGLEIRAKKEAEYTDSDKKWVAKQILKREWARFAINDFIEEVVNNVSQFANNSLEDRLNEDNAMQRAEHFWARIRELEIGYINLENNLTQAVQEEISRRLKVKDPAEYAMMLVRELVEDRKVEMRKMKTYGEMKEVINSIGDDIWTTIRGLGFGYINFDKYRTAKGGHFITGIKAELWRVIDEIAYNRVADMVDDVTAIRDDYEAAKYLKTHYRDYDVNAEDIEQALNACRKFKMYFSRSIYGALVTIKESLSVGKQAA